MGAFSFMRRLKAWTIRKRERIMSETIGYGDREDREMGEDAYGDAKRLQGVLYCTVSLVPFASRGDWTVGDLVRTTSGS